MKIAAIIPAAGQGKRFSTKKLKPLVLVGGKPIIVHTITNLKTSWKFEEIILVVPAEQIKNFKDLLSRYRLTGVRITIGGKTRAASVRNGFYEVSDRSEWVLIHDAARPLVSKPVVERLANAAIKSGASIAVMPITSTVKRIRVGDEYIHETEDRNTLYVAQTPQLFRKKLLAERYRETGDMALRATDEAALFDGTGIRVRAIRGESSNIKVTTREDLDIFKFYLNKRRS